MAPEPSDHGQGGAREQVKNPGYVLAPAQLPRASSPGSRHQVSSPNPKHSPSQLKLPNQSPFFRLCWA